jgi:hypothetical protein
MSKLTVPNMDEVKARLINETLDSIVNHINTELNHKKSLKLVFPIRITLNKVLYTENSGNPDYTPVIQNNRFSIFIHNRLGELMSELRERGYSVFIKQDLVPKPGGEVGYKLIVNVY